eukprot:2225437-Rhodomonas_salina.3
MKLTSRTWRGGSRQRAACVSRTARSSSPRAGQHLAADDAGAWNRAGPDVSGCCCQMDQRQGQG